MTAVTLSSQASDPGAGDVLTVTRDFGDGSALATGLEVTHAYAEDGEYLVARARYLACDPGGRTHRHRSRLR